MMIATTEMATLARRREQSRHLPLPQHFWLASRSEPALSMSGASRRRSFIW
jgi:hypothetical protein